MVFIGWDGGLGGVEETTAAMPSIPAYQDIEAAHERIKPYIHQTPCFTSHFFNEITGGDIYFKCENLQRVGAFKIRGAANAIFSLKEDELNNGVLTHSSGNHAQAVALAAKWRKTKAYIVMPENSPQVKVNAVKGYGGEVIFCKPTLEAREATAKKIQDETGAVFIPPYDDPLVIAGQGTAFKELCEEVGALDFLFSPVGGGGLLSGSSISARHLCLKIKVIGCEPKGADDAYRSFISGKLLPSINPNTCADGLLTSLSELTFSIISKNVDEIVTVDENEIIRAMRWVWERMKLIIEPSSAVAVAALVKKKNELNGKKAGVILSGGNVDLQRAVKLLEETKN